MMFAFNEQIPRMEEQVVLVSNESSSLYTEAPTNFVWYRITWHYVNSSTSSEALTEEGFYSPYADRVLTAEEYTALRELLANHPEVNYSPTSR